MSETNLEIVRRLFDHWERGDYWWGGELYDPDIEFVMPPDAFPDPGTHRGIKAMTAAWRAWLSAWEDFHVVGTELADGGEHIVASYRIYGRGRASGAELEQPVNNVFTFRAGRIVRMVLYGDDRERALRDAGIG